MSPTPGLKLGLATRGQDTVPNQGSVLLGFFYFSGPQAVVCVLTWGLRPHPASDFMGFLHSCFPDWDEGRGVWPFFNFKTLETKISGCPR